MLRRAGAAGRKCVPADWGEVTGTIGFTGTGVHSQTVYKPRQAKESVLIGEFCDSMKGIWTPSESEATIGMCHRCVSRGRIK